jgi:hypothetical protein
MKELNIQIEPNQLIRNTMNQAQIKIEAANRHSKLAVNLNAKNL